MAMQSSSGSDDGQQQGDHHEVPSSAQCDDPIFPVDCVRRVFQPEDIWREVFEFVDMAEYKRLKESVCREFYLMMKRHARMTEELSPRLVAEGYSLNAVFSKTCVAADP
eukprot:EC692949.1.p2 GENE.EC692949.1~~EC692949.1.p2  ORF type:complete len:109 (+),score=27.56 EC692949.1:128-454(+)